VGRVFLDLEKIGMTVKHAPDPLQVRETLCGCWLAPSGQQRHVLANVGDSINCRDCRIVLRFAMKCIAPHNFRLARVP
jgi:hypothetical protein